MKLYFSYLKMMLCIAVTALFSVGCNENTNDFPPLEGNIMITQATEQIQTAPQTASECTIHFTTLQDWNTTLYMEKEEVTDEDWISITPTSGERGEHVIKAVLLANDKDYDRLATITIHCGGESIECRITQTKSDSPSEDKEDE